MLLDAWDGIAGVAFRRDDCDFERSLELVSYTMAGIDRDWDRESNREVFLTFRGPSAMTKRLFKTLQRKGLKITKQVDEDLSITRCRLTLRPPSREQCNRGGSG